jgi:hypothetical protein
MLCLHPYALIAALIVVIFVAPISFAQNTASPPAPSQVISPSGVNAPAPKPTLSNRIKRWSSAQWEALKEYWSKSQQKWDDCVKRS